MKELILNNFGVLGMIIFIADIYFINSNLTNKWGTAGLWLLVISAMIGLVSSFEFIGKWLLK